MNKNYFFLLILLFLYSCENVKNALSGKKYENSDEFLVIKKNPLVLPPNFNDLPTPKDVAETNQIDNIEDIKSFDYDGYVFHEELSNDKDFVYAR